MKPTRVLCFQSLWLFAFLVQGAIAQLPERPALPDFDRRAGGGDTAPTQARAAAIGQLRAQIPNASVDFDEVVGGPKWVRAQNQYLTGPGGEGKAISAATAARFAVNDPYRGIKGFLQEHADLFGYGAEALSTAAVYREYVTPHNGMKTTLWQQQVDGIDIYQAVFAANVTSEAELISVSSRFMATPSQAADAGAANPAARAVPLITARQAVVNAAASLAESVDATAIGISGPGAAGQDQRQQFTAAPFNDTIQTRLIWLPMNPSLMRLCWEVRMTSRARGETFQLLVDAQTGEIQLRQRLTVYLTDATYRVYTSDSPSPFSPGWSAPNSAQPALTSRVLITCGALDTNASPNGWIDDGVNETRGNNVDAHTDTNGDDLPDLPRPQGTPPRVFDFAMDPGQSPATYKDAAVVQLFYWCNYMHDRLYQLGFTEAAGNYQNNNFGRGGLGNDAVQADAQDGSGYNNANFTPTPDGSPPRIQMFLFNGPTPARDGDFDAEVVLHEYTHGLSERLVGGGAGISALQTGGMGEGWSDWYALSMLSESGDDVNGCYGPGGYATYLLSGLTQNYYFGIRRYPYSTYLSKNPLTFKDIDPAQASAHSAVPRSPIIGTTANEVHNMGEVWCVTLWEARASLVARYGWAMGNTLMMRLVTDGMKLGPANPNFVQARDAILLADQVDNAGADLIGLWTAFAKRGLGFGATSPSSSTTAGLHESYDIPDDLQITPTAVSANGPVGGPFTPGTVSFALINTGTNALSWTLSNTSSWVTVFPNGGTLTASAPGTNVVLTILPAANGFPLGTYNCVIQFTNRTSGAVQARTLSLFVVGRNLYDSFDPGINLSQWSGFGGTIGSTVIATNYGGFISSPNSLWFGDGGSRFATTVPVNTSSGGTVAFYICLANGSAWPWEQVDYLPDEGVVLESSTNSGATWTVLGSYDTTAYYSWTPVTLSIPAVAQSPATLFRWRQKSHSGASFDHWALDNVTIDAGPTPPTIQAQPQDQTVTVGNTATFSVTAIGSSPLSYAWYLNGGLISGATGSSYSTNGVQLVDSGSQFRCVISNAFGVVTSSVATLTVIAAPPSIITHPLSQTVAVGSSATFTVGASGSAPLSYSWRRNGSPIPGANSPSYTIYSAQLSDSGTQFSCIASNAFGSALSSNATLYVTVTSAPVFLNGSYLYLPIETNGVFLAASTGGKFNSAGTGGSSGVDFWWPGTPVYNYVIGVNGSNYADGNFQTMTVSNLSVGGIQRALIDATVVTGLHFTRDISFASNGKVIRFVDTLRNDGPSAIANVVTLDSTDPDQDSTTTFSTANDVMSINLPNDLVVATGPTTGLSVGFGSESGRQIPSAIGFDNRDAYSFLTVVDPDGASADIAINLAQNYGTLASGNSISTVWYMVFDVSKAAVTNAFAVLALTSNAPVILAQPASKTVILGGTATFNVNATGTPPLSYQWRFNGANLPGETNGILQLAGVQYSQAGNYAVLVTNAFGSVLSSNAALSVAPYATNIAVIPQSPATVGNCIPFGDNTDYAFTGFIYRNVPAFSVNPGDTLRFDLGAQNDRDVRRNIYIAQADKNPVAGGASQDVHALGWVQIVSDSQIPANPRGNTVIGDYELTYTIEAPFSFSGGGLILGFGGSPPGTYSDNTCDGVMVGTTAGDVSGNFHRRFYYHPDRDTGTLDSTNSDISSLGGFMITATSPAVWILAQPTNQVVYAGNAATFQVIAGGAPPFSYQWMLNGTNILNGTNNLLLLSDVQPTDAGNYSVLVSNLAGSVLSSNAMLIVLEPLSITTQPVSQTVPVNGTATFLVTASGTGPISYDWRRNGIPIPGARGTAYSLTNAQLIDSGSKFSCLVSNATQSVLSSNALLKVIDMVSNDECSSAVVIPGFQNGASYTNSQSTAKATSTGDPVPSCVPDFGNGVWYQFSPLVDGFMTVDTVGSDFDTGLAVYLGTCGSLIELACNDDADGTTSQVAIPVTHGTTYYILAGGYSAYVGNLVLHLTELAPPIILAQPTDQTVIVGSNATFSAVVAGGLPLEFQWCLNGAPITDDGRITGTTTPSLSIGNAQTYDAGVYSLVVTNVFGSTVSTGAVLTVLVPPSILTQPVGCSVPLGMPASFTSSASGTTPLSYQWQRNAVDIPGATNDMCLITAAGTNDFGVYRLVVSNAAGVAISSDALLTWGQIAAWGRNDYGQTIVPPNLTNVTMISGGGLGSFPGHSLALRSDGTVAAWGYNSYGQTNVPPGATNIVAVCAGGMHSVALRANGTVLAWGNNSYGQINVPTTLSNVVAIAAGGQGSVALRSDGKVIAWGNNTYGQATPPPSLINVAAIGAGVLHNVALRSDGTVAAWGNNYNGQTNVPLDATNVVSLAAGLQNTLALRANGTLLTWGTNPYVLNIPAALTNVTAIAAGDSYYEALLSDGSVTVWGSPGFGVTNVPPAVSNAVAVSGGGTHVLALLGDGRPVITRQPVGGTTYVGRDFAFGAGVTGTGPLTCQWQFNGADLPGATNTTLVLFGLSLTNSGVYQLIASNSLGVTASVPVPLTVISYNTLTFLSQPASQTNYQAGKTMLGASVIGNGPVAYQWYFAGTNQIYAPILNATNNTLTLDPALAGHSGSYYVTASNPFIRITSPSASLRVMFAKSWGYLATDPPFNLTNASAIAVGSAGTGTTAGHYLALRSDGKISPWGTSIYGETNTTALNNSFVTALAAGYQDSLALRSDGTVYAWGYNSYGETNSPAGLSGVVAIDCGLYHDLALKGDGTVAAWGNNVYGQGTNSVAATNVIAIASGDNFNIALRADSTITAWGENSNGQTVIPPAATNVIAIAAGAQHVIALRANGTLVGWGNNAYSQATIPAGLSNVVAISAAYNHSIALRSDGSVVTWGAYYSGSRAIAPMDLANVIQISSGGDHDVALFGTRAPAITIQPVGRTVSNGATNVQFVAKAAGLPPVSYQWRYNNVDIPGATNDILRFTSAQFSQAGAYQLVASNSYGVAFAKPAKLTVTVPLGEALDATNRAWTTTGNSLWYGQISVSHDGVDAARSGDLGNNQESVLQTVLFTNGAAHCTFWWKVSSEDYFDYLEFRVNGSSLLSISGEIDWQQCSVALAAGTNTLQWRYSKDSSYSSGQDAGWVDQFTFTADPPVITLQPVSQRMNLAATAQFRVTATGVTPLVYQWWQNGTPVGGNNPLLTMPNVNRASSGVYSVRVSNPGGATFSSNAVLTVLVPQKLGNPALQPDGSLLITSADADGSSMTTCDPTKFTVFTSTNLVDWAVLPNTLSVSNGVLWLLDVPATNYSQKFYRIIENP